MAWRTPVTNRKDGQTQTTATDFNRICENINIAFGTNLKTNWTRDDIVDSDTWDLIINTVSVEDETISFKTDFANLNKIEAATLKKHNE